MKRGQIILMILFSIFSSTCFGADQKLLIKADLVWYSHGIWRMAIEEYGDAGGARVTYETDRKNVYDKVSGHRVKPIFKRTTLSREQVSQIEEVINSKQFFEIKEYLAPKVFQLHRPKYRLNVCIDDECHKVTLFNIERLPKHLLADFEKIKIVWNLLWSFSEDSGFSQVKL